MSLLKCHECGGGVSSEAKSCPACGAKVKKPISKALLVLIALTSILVYKCSSETSEINAKRPAPPPKTAEQLEKEKKEIAENQAIQVKLRALKESTKNPDSFKLEQAIYTDAKILCVIYRGTNSFGAIVKEGKAITERGGIGNFDKQCRDKEGRSVRSLGP